MPRRRPRPWQPERSGRGRPAPSGAAAGVRRLDLHGYDVATAVDLTVLTLREAYQNGYRQVDVLHGSRGVVHPVDPGEGRGGIKWELRRMIDRGQFDAWADSAEVMEGSVRFRMRKNPRMRSERWTELPPGRG
jgi:hypothetical protein